MDVPIWIAISHDWTKLTPTEWPAYVRQFFSPDGTMRNAGKTDAYNPNSRSLEFKKAWLSHQRNKHHWQAWISIGDKGSLTALPIPEIYVREMIADWIGAGQAQSGHSDPRAWYASNKGNMILHEDTRKLLEKLLETCDVCR